MNNKAEVIKQIAYIIVNHAKPVTFKYFSAYSLTEAKKKRIYQLAKTKNIPRFIQKYASAFALFGITFDTSIEGNAFKEILYNGKSLSL